MASKKKTTSTVREQSATRSSSKSTSRQAPVIHVVTDGTGGLPRHFLTAILSQFPEKDGDPVYHVFCDPAKIERVFKKAVTGNSVVFHALVESKSKDLLTELAGRRKIPHFDLTGDALAFLAQHTGWAAANDLDRVHASDGHYFDRIEAWEFTMQHDDSLRLESIGQAEIILVGLSRVSKTPTAAYLGWLGHRVANVSFTPEIGLPQDVEKLRKKVVALTMQPKRLSELRARRMEVNGFAGIVDGHAPEIRYAGIRDTIREVMAAEEIYTRMRLPVVDVTYATVEETAAKVLEITRTANTTSLS
jgi:hypothetical protein